MIIFAGPFVGEFGWELVFWHGWLRKIKKDLYPDSFFIVSSFPGRKPLYEFADEFIKLPDFYVNNKFSERDYFIDWEIYQDDKRKKTFNEIQKLIDFFHKKFEKKKVNYIYNYPQKKYSRKLFNRIQNKSEIIFHKTFNFKKENINFENKILNFNKHAGIKIPDPFILNPVNREIKDLYNPQYPELVNQNWIKLKPTNLGIKLRDEILMSYDNKSRPIFTVFPRKRITRRPDKNWDEDKWKKFLKLVIDKFDAIIVLSGTSEGAFLADEPNSKNIINIIKKPKELSLELQLAFLEVSKIAIHGRSGSCNLSLQNGCPTFMAGPEEDRKIICEDQNPLNSEIFYYTEYGVNPDPYKLFEIFVSYYNKIIKVL